MRTNELRLDDRSPVPIYVQIHDQMLHALARGSVRKGERLPAVRDMASALGVNPNTVNRAYAELEREGVLETRRGRGTFVAGAPPAPGPSQRVRLDELAERFVAQARSVGFESDRIARAVTVQLRKQR
jgi:GntR family transcriptional regulator